MTEILEKPALDLVLRRRVDVPRKLIWRAWTEPELLKQWFTPAPWKTVDCRIDLRPGGEFFTVMRSPEGQDHANVGCFLEVVPHERLTWTDALLPGFRPSEKAFMTAIVTLESDGAGTRYTATALHRNDADRQRHLDMGFEQGWATAFDQLVALVRGKFM